MENKGKYEVKFRAEGGWGALFRAQRLGSKNLGRGNYFKKILFLFDKGLGAIKNREPRKKRYENVISSY